MSPRTDYFENDGQRALAICLYGTDGGKSLVSRVDVMEQKIIEVTKDVEELNEHIKDMKKTQSAYGKSTIFLLLGILATILTALFNSGVHK